MQAEVISMWHSFFDKEPVAGQRNGGCFLEQLDNRDICFVQPKQGPGELTVWLNIVT